MKLRYIGLFLLPLAVAIGDERRAPAPTFDQTQLEAIFFESLDEALDGKRPTLAELRAKKDQKIKAEPTTGEGNDDAQLGWAKIISPPSIEDEVKRLRFRFEKSVAAPGTFKGGGYLEARVDLTALATLFAVIHDYSGEIRWKSDAASARDLMARTARGCKAGTNPVFNDAVNRKLDLESLVSGSGIVAAKSEVTDNDWTQIADRSPLMEYAELLVAELDGLTVDAGKIESEPEAVRRYAELLGMLGEAIIQEGMEGADDEEYVKFSRAMTAQAMLVTDALERKDYSAASAAAAEIQSQCDNCHAEYR
jgi:hypothetical protein